MKKMAAFLISFAIFVGVFQGCAPTEERHRGGKLKIVCTLFAQYDFTRSIVGNRADVSLLLPIGAESHAYEPTPSDIISLKNADLFIYVGEEMETWIKPILPQLDGGTVVLELSKALGLKIESHNHKHAAETNTAGETNAEGEEITADEKTAEDKTSTEGETNAEDKDTSAPHGTRTESAESGTDILSGGERLYDPHIWTSPMVAVRMTEAIRDALIKLDGAGESFYSGNAESYIIKLWQLDERIRNVVAEAKRTEIIFGGRFALRNFADEYGLSYLAAFDSCTEETEPSAAAVARIIDEIKSKHIPVVFYEELMEPAVAQSLAKETGAKPLLFHSCHNLSAEDFKNGETYESLMRHNIENLIIALN
jgi:zinc transport system substrate-binding protein